VFFWYSFLGDGGSVIAQMTAYPAQLIKSFGSCIILGIH